MLAMITREQLKAFAPHARQDYVEALLAGQTHLRAAGILDSNLTLTHFMAQVGGETNGLTIVRESLNYKSVARIRQVWPARSRKTPPSADLVNNPVALGAWAYGGRMGNNYKNDGYAFRGGGFIQTTGRDAVTRYCKACSLPVDDSILDNPAATLQFACFEWKQSGCNPYAKSNDILSVSKIINTGSAKSGIMPNGLSDRRLWLKRAWAVWGDARDIPAATSVSAQDLKKAGSETISSGQLLQGIGGASVVASGTAEAVKVINPPVVDIPAAVSLPTPEDISALEQMKTAGEQADVISTAMGSLKGAWAMMNDNFWLFGILIGLVVIYLGRNVIKRRVADARLALNTARLALTGDLKDLPVPEPSESGV